MEVDKFEEDFFVEIPFKSLFIEPLPNESVLHRERLNITEVSAGVGLENSFDLL